MAKYAHIFGLTQLVLSAIVVLNDRVAHYFSTFSSLQSATQAMNIFMFKL